ncbi:MAG: PTS lactose/cellobiose transporter subunit IIA [Aerococcaceae bacterium]|nr:PTS lactose/cellobiose transporter subunit IIA [Aerococcaceae bacterium]
MNEVNFEEAMALIIHSGNAKSLAMEALQHAKKKDFAEAEEKLYQASSEITLAHKEQTKLLTKEASGEISQFSLLIVHSQDHLMTAMTFIDLVKEIIDIYREL